MASMRFFSLEPLQLDLSRSPNAAKDDILADRMLQLTSFDFTNEFTGKPPRSSLLDQISVSQIPPAVQDIPRPVRRRRGSVAAATVVSESLTATIARLCNLSTPFWTDARLKDISASGQQIDVRNEQARLLPAQYRILKRRVHEGLPSAAAHYISFYNCIWLILNDIVVGYTLGVFLRENSEYLGRVTQAQVDYYTVQLVRECLVWLDDWPAGLKLNTELSRFFYLSFLGGVNIWAMILSNLAPWFPLFIYVLGCVGPLGVTFTLSVSSDLLSAITTPLYMSYLAATAIFRLQLSMAGSLFRLFRGKRRNVLQNRTDAWDYDMDQLLLGTILFTLLAFLFPTVVVYYALFALFRLAIIMIHASLETCLAFMNHFPLFAIMVRLKDPARLPGGVYVELKGSPPEPVIKNASVPLGRIFYQHLRVWSNLTAHYSPLRLLRCLFTGTYITPIPRYSIRYDSTRGFEVPPP